jgi:hypothetical protein
MVTLPFPKMLVKLLEFDGRVTRDNLPVLLEKWAERFFPQEFCPRGTCWQSQHEASFQSKLDEGASDCTKTDSSSLTIDDFLIGFEVICSEEEEEVVIGEDFKVDCFRFQITDVMVLMKSVGFMQDPLAFLTTWILGAKILEVCTTVASWHGMAWHATDSPPRPPWCGMVHAMICLRVCLSV